MLKKLCTLLTALLIIGCENDLTLVVDTYEPPYDIMVIPTIAGINISFWSGILATDFAGFNIYVNSTGVFNQPTDAIQYNIPGGLPTLTNEYHSRKQFTLTVPGTYTSGTLYYVTVTSYGTNSLAEKGYLETKITRVLKVVPRPEGDIIVNDGGAVIANGISVATINAGSLTKTITPIAPYQIQNLGTRTSFNEVVTITNIGVGDFDAAQKPIVQGSMFVLINGTSLVKIYVTSMVAGTTTIHWSHLANIGLFLPDPPSL